MKIVTLKNCLYSCSVTCKMWIRRLNIYHLFIQNQNMGFCNLKLFTGVITVLQMMVPRTLGKKKKKIYAYHEASLVFLV